MLEADKNVLKELRQNIVDAYNQLEQPEKHYHYFLFLVWDLDDALRGYSGEAPQDIK